jgi:hypothetical protein
MDDSSLPKLEPEQLDFLKALAQANENVPAEKRQIIRGIRADGVLNLMHPGFSNGRLVPNDYDLHQLNTLGLISAHDRGGRKGWIVEILPAGRQCLALYVAETGPKTAKTVKTLAAMPTEQGPRDPKVEAIGLLDKVIQDIEEGTRPLENILRRCTRVAHLLGEKKSADVFSKEITGYFDSDEPAYYRRIRGSIIWKTIGVDHLNDPADVAAKTASRFHGNPPCEFLARSGIERLRAAATDDYWQPSQVVQSHQVPDGKSMVGTWVDAVESYPPQIFGACLKTIEQVTYDWAVQWLVYLRYESRITNIWQSYRSSVDSRIEEMSLRNHLQSIDRNLVSSNEQDWRNALYGCRSILQDVATHLWHDTRDSYTPIQVEMANGNKRAMRVTESDYVNRLQAYLHQKSTKGAQTDLIESEAKYLGALFFRLNKLDNHAHAGATRDLAESAAIHTYVFLAELIRRTDMEPIERYEG